MARDAQKLLSADDLKAIAVLVPHAPIDDRVIAMLRAALAKREASGAAADGASGAGALEHASIISVQAAIDARAARRRTFRVVMVVSPLAGEDATPPGHLTIARDA